MCVCVCVCVYALSLGRQRPPLFQLGFSSENWDWWRTSSQFHLRYLETSHTFAAASSASPIQKEKKNKQKKNLKTCPDIVVPPSSLVVPPFGVPFCRCVCYACHILFVFHLFIFSFFCLLWFYSVFFVRIGIAWIIKYMGRSTCDYCAIKLL